MANKIKDVNLSAYPEVEEIRHDLESLKNNVVELTRHVQQHGAKRATDVSKKARQSLSDLQRRGKAEMNKIEKKVKEKPGQSLAVAFVAGLITSILLGRK
jgi:ElaB/YqjD/DUF883 family membrane-anchored ribosome-binding protein